MSIASKTREEALKTRRLIIDTATAVILKKGYERATLLDIAAQTGMTRGAVYGNFKNKSELFECILSNWTLPETLADALTSELPLSRTCCDTLQSLEKDGLYQIVLSLATGSAAEQEDAVPEKAVRRSYQKLLGLFEKILLIGQQKGDVSKKQNVSAAAEVLLSYLAGLGKIWRVEKSSFSLSEWARGFVDIFLRGLRENP